jgi:mannosyltransferase OCH1-like enzyme
MADVMRFLIISKYPGLYLDHDVFSLVPMSSITSSNYACIQSVDVIAIGVVSIDKDGLKAIEFHLR